MFDLYFTGQPGSYYQCSLLHLVKLHLVLYSDNPSWYLLGSLPQPLALADSITDCLPRKLWHTGKFFSPDLSFWQRTTNNLLNLRKICDQPSTWFFFFLIVLYFQGTLHKEKDQKYFKISFIFQASQTGEDRQSQALAIYRMLAFTCSWYFIFLLWLPAKVIAVMLVVMILLSDRKSFHSSTSSLKTNMI